MKKVLSMIVMLVIGITTSINAQKDSTKLIQKIQGGMIVGVFGSTMFQGTAQPFSMNYGLLANITVITPKTYTNLMYGFPNNSLRLLNGYFLPRKWDVYLVYSRGLNPSQNPNYLGLGIEKMLVAEKVKNFLFAELGTDFKGDKILSIGVLMSFQNVFWKRK